MATVMIIAGVLLAATGVALLLWRRFRRPPPDTAAKIRAALDRLDKISANTTAATEKERDRVMEELINEVGEASRADVAARLLALGRRAGRRQTRKPRVE